jgi:hypothetical protein
MVDKGYMNFVEFSASLAQFFKSEIERDLLGLFYMTDLNKPVFLLTN